MGRQKNRVRIRIQVEVSIVAARTTQRPMKSSTCGRQIHLLVREIEGVKVSSTMVPAAEMVTGQVPQ